MNKILRISILCLTTALLLTSSKNKYEIGECYITFNTATNFTAAEPDKLPGTSERIRTVMTEKGEVDVSRIAGYRVLYNNQKNVPFVNLKVELSEKKSYEKDKKNLIEHLKYLNSNSTGMETKELIELEFNGYKAFGLSRGTIESGSTLGTFVMFPGKGVTVYFYFNNLKPEYRNFESVDDYKKQRDRFIEEYTNYLTSCKEK